MRLMPTEKYFGIFSPFQMTTLLAIISGSGIGWVAASQDTHRTNTQKTLDASNAYWAGAAGKIKLLTTQSGHQSVSLVNDNVTQHIGAVTPRTRLSFKGTQISTISAAEHHSAVIIARVVPRPGSEMWSEILEATVLVKY